MYTVFLVLYHHIRTIKKFNSNNLMNCLFVKQRGPVINGYPWLSIINSIQVRKEIIFIFNLFWNFLMLFTNESLPTPITYTWTPNLNLKVIVKLCILNFRYIDFVKITYPSTILGFLTMFGVYRDPYCFCIRNEVNWLIYKNRIYWKKNILLH